MMAFFTGCNDAPGIIQREYKNEKTASENHRFTFDMYLETIGNSGKSHDLIQKLIYGDRNFDEYIEYRENDFIETEADYPLMADKDGTEYMYESELMEKYSIVFNNDAYILFEYNTYAYSSWAAHGNSLAGYFFIDIGEERLLTIDDLMHPIPDDILKSSIESEYDINDYFRETIWPPDAVNFCNKNIELLWNTYTLAPHAYGTLCIEIQDDISEQYLTDKGKALKKATAGKK